MDRNHLFHYLAVGLTTVLDERPRSRQPFVAGTRKLLNELFEQSIRAPQWTDYK